MSAMEIVDLASEHLGPKATRVRAYKDGAVRVVLYDAIVCVLRPDDYGDGKSWGLSIVLAPEVEISQVLGRKLTLLTGSAQVSAALSVADTYARLRLGTEYLEMFEATRAVSDGQ